MDKKIAKQPSIFSIMASKYKLDQSQFLSVIKKTIMPKGKNVKEATMEEIAAFLIVAQKYNLDPFTNEIYAFPSKKGGIVPIVGVDGFARIMNSQKGFDGYAIVYSEDEVVPVDGRLCPTWAEIKIYHKHREHPTVMREYLDEVYVGKRGDFKGPWQTHTKRMLRHKIIIQGIRIAFGITGIYDQDEAERIIDAEIADTTNMKPEVKMPEALPEGQKEEKKEEKKEENAYKKMLEQFEIAKGVLGEKAYYDILTNKYNYFHANAIKKISEGEKILKEMNQKVEEKDG